MALVLVAVALLLHLLGVGVALFPSVLAPGLMMLAWILEGGLVSDVLLVSASGLDVSATFVAAAAVTVVVPLKLYLLTRHPRCCFAACLL